VTRQELRTSARGREAGDCSERGRELGTSSKSSSADSGTRLDFAGPAETTSVYKPKLGTRDLHNLNHHRQPCLDLKINARY